MINGAFRRLMALFAACTLARHPHVFNTLQVLPEGSAFDDVFGEAGARSLEDKGVLLDGFKPPSTAMYSMFPDEQELLQQGWDAYGAVVDTTELRKTEGMAQLHLQLLVQCVHTCVLVC